MRTNWAAPNTERAAAPPPFRLVTAIVQTSSLPIAARHGQRHGRLVDAVPASRYERVEGSEVDWSAEQKAQRPVREYLAALESQNSPVNPGQAPKALSPADPAAVWTTRGPHKVMLGYSLNYLIDFANAIIVDVEATPTRISKRSMPPRP